MGDDDAFEISIQLTRGTSTDDRDKIKAKVAARDVDELDRKMGEVKDRLELWADELREVQPDGETVRDHALDDDQATLEEGSA